MCVCWKKFWRNIENNLEFVIGLQRTETVYLILIYLGAGMCNAPYPFCHSNLNFEKPCCFIQVLLDVFISSTRSGIS